MSAETTTRREAGDGAARACADPRQLDLEADGLGVAPDNLPVPVDTKNARLPINYQAATHALAQCERVDECKEWVNKAEAIAAYARMADDDTLYKTATRIKARAVDRCGQLLKQFKTGPEGRRPKENKGGASPVSQAQAGRRAGMSDDQVKQAVRVNNVPRETFEKLVESDDPPTVTKLAEIGKSSKPGREDPPQNGDAKSNQRPKKHGPTGIPHVDAPPDLNHVVVLLRNAAKVSANFPAATKIVSDARSHGLIIDDAEVRAAAKFFSAIAAGVDAGPAGQEEVSTSVAEPAPECDPATWVPPCGPTEGTPAGVAFYALNYLARATAETTPMDVLKATLSDPYALDVLPGAIRRAARFLDALRDLLAREWEKTGSLDERRVLILTPSDRPGYTHYTVIDLITREAVGPKRPVRDDELEKVIRVTCNAPMPTHWEYTRSTRHRDNPHLIGSEPVIPDEQRSAMAEPQP